MPINPLNKWSSDYVDKTKKLFEKPDDKNAAIELWQNWIDDNSNAGNVTCPALIATPSSPTLNKKSINPVFLPTGTPPTTALILAGEWFKYWSTSIWSMAAPSPAGPYSAVTSIIIEPASLAGAQAVLQATLTTIFAVPEKELDIKAKALGNAFFTASSSLMVNIIGLSKAVPPVPLITPFKVS